MTIVVDVVIGIKYGHVIKCVAQHEAELPCIRFFFDKVVTGFVPGSPCAFRYESMISQMPHIRCIVRWQLTTALKSYGPGLNDSMRKIWIWV